MEIAQIWIKPLDETALKSYLAAEESLGKTGPYSVQREGAQLLEKHEGYYPTVVELPLWRTAKIQEQQGLVCPNPAEEIYRLKPHANWKDFN